MNYFDQTNSLISSLGEIDLLINLIISNETTSIEDNTNDNMRSILLKSSIVILVSKFQVFIEDLLKDIKYKINNSNVDFRCSDYLRVLSLKKQVEALNLNKKLENPTTYNVDLITNLSSGINILHNHCDSEKFMQENICFNTSYKLGKTGVNELKELFKQFEGKNDIFENSTVDINIMNAILNTRHTIVHKDSITGITKEQVISYKTYIIELSKFIDAYLFSFINA
ncbi:MAG: hypothetical protein IBX70_11770 [Clostridia bacterium]|nr:hypothetical protein [Clostridia bacterium]